ncbi:NUDIX hydrolase [Nakamurella lactea]|uniref:NUDIX hydrolase n=1 Tax=Nakamurella lactea TaxID=459515 RepID=UPI0003FD0492|nr:NUDIX domain-containing protein [Nakamurella lactea]
MTPTFITAAFCFVRDGRLLTVRKAGTQRFQLPGGKIDPGETPWQAAVREVSEEIGLDCSGAEQVPLGEFTDKAANEPGATVRATVFVGALTATDSPKPLAEIAELRWYPLDAAPAPELAPLLARKVIPALRAHRAG